MPRSGQSRWVAAANGVGVAALVPMALLPVAWVQGGLAPVAVAGVVALLVGAPAAVAEWRADRPLAPSWRAALLGLTDLVTVGAIAAAAAPWIAHWGALGVGVTALCLGIAWVAARHPATAVLPVGFATLGAVALAATTLLSDAPRSDPWTLLVPQWTAWSEWLGAAVVSGLWAGAATTGAWSFGLRRWPGQNRAPWASVGTVWLLVTGWAVFQAGQYETHAVLGFSDPVGAIGMALVCTSAAASLLRRRNDTVAATSVGSHQWPRFDLLCIALAWLAFPAAGVVPFGWSALLPLGMAVIAALVVLRVEAFERVVLLAVVGLALAGAALQWSGVPADMADAARAGLTLTVAFWILATRVTLAHQSNPQWTPAHPEHAP